VKATAKLTHWNTVEIYDYGRTSDGTFYYVMELLDGCNLAELVDRFGPLTPARAVFLLKQMCEALDEAHSMNLIHRDLKPQNIFVSRLGNKYDIIKLLDFGLVKIQTSSGRETSTDSNKRSFCGTPLFMPPGQVTSYDQVDGRSDIYALGCLAYFMVTGRPPFLGKKTNEVLTAHAVEPVVPPSSINSNISGQLDAAILKCLEKLPVDRFQNVGELAKAVGACEFPKDWTDDLAKQWWSTVGVNLKLSDIEVFRRTSAESATVLMPELDHQVDGI
jgi:serine/threonine-protein kinase